MTAGKVTLATAGVVITPALLVIGADVGDLRAGLVSLVLRG
jgi:hypothetical protein